MDPSNPLSSVRRSYSNRDNTAMHDTLTTLIEGESRTGINEVARGSLLESYRQTNDVDGRSAEGGRLSDEGVRS